MTELANPDAQRRLWCAVILQALDDAIGIGAVSNARERAYAKRDARAWLFTPSRDFDQACALAGIDPEQTRNRARLMIEEVDRTGERRKKTGIKVKPKAPPRTNIIDQTFTHNGETLTIREWLERTGTPEKRFRCRIYEGWGTHDAIFKPKGRLGEGWRRNKLGPLSKAPKSKEPKTDGRKKLYTYDGKSMSLPEWAKHLGTKHNTLYARIKKNWPFELVFSVEDQRSNKSDLRNKIASNTPKHDTIVQFQA